MIQRIFLPGLAAGALLFAGCAAQNAAPAPGFQQIVSEAGGKVFPAVVYIQVVTGNLKSGRAQNDVVSGSGVLITPDGELLSNWHVVDKAQSIRCLLNDGRAFTAKVVGLDKDLDLSLLKLDLPEGTPPLPYAAIDYEDRLTEGDFVMAMGAPWGLNRSVSIGIVSCASRYLPEGTYSLWYQTDASISPGNSGGPLVNTDGKVVGINTLGMLMGGVIVSGTEPGSPARKAGFLPNDRIVAIDGKPVTVGTNEEMPGFRRMLGLLPFGKPVAFTVVREGETVVIDAAPVAKGEVEGEEVSCPRWGFTAKAINRFDTPNLHYYRNSGVYIYGVSDFGNAAQAELRPNDILVSIDGEPVNTPAELETLYRKAMERLDTNPKATFAVLRNGRMIQRVMDFSNDYEKE